MIINLGYKQISSILHLNQSKTSNQQSSRIIVLIFHLEHSLVREAPSLFSQVFHNLNGSLLHGKSKISFKSDKLTKQREPSLPSKMMNDPFEISPSINIAFPLFPKKQKHFSQDNILIQKATFFSPSFTKFNDKIYLWPLL